MFIEDTYINHFAGCTNENGSRAKSLMCLYLMLYKENFLHVCVSSYLIIINIHIIATVEYSVPQKTWYLKERKERKEKII